MILHTQLVFNKYFRRIAYSAMVIYIILTLAIIFPIDFYGSRATEVPVEAETTLDVTSTRIDIPVMLDEEDEVGQFFSASTDVSVATNNYTGYTARLSAMRDEDHDKMYAEDGENYIASIEENVSAEEFSEDTEFNGRFGFKPSKLNSIDNEDYVPAPNAEGIVIEKTTSANDEANEYNVEFGVRLDRSALVGTYSNSYSVTATVNPVPYLITYGDGVEDEAIEVPDPQGDITTTPVVTLSPMVPVRENYIFRGWCSGEKEEENFVETCNGCTYQPGDPLDLNMTSDNDVGLEAMWERVYVVGFDINGGFGETPDDVEVKRDDDMPRVENAMPTKTGYTLTGWYDAPNGGSKYYNADGTSAKKWDKTDDGVILYANWVANNYYIAYAGNNNTSGIMANTTCTYDQECVLRTNTFARNGYNFNGWTYGGVAYGDGQTVFNLATEGTITFTAQWDIVYYSITYYGSNASNPTSYSVETATITLNNPSQNGYNFAGWTGSNGSTKQTTVTIPKGSTGDKSYTANYTPINYTISYNYNGGSASNTTSYNIETNTFTLNNPTRNGYTFAGWTGSNGSTKQMTVSITKGTTGDKSYTANWTPVPYSITYYLGGGTVSPANPTSYNIETATFALRNPTRPYYSFSGWTGSNGSTAQTSVSITKGSTGDKTYYASYTPIPYGITYNYDGGTASNPSSYNYETNTFTLNNPTKPGHTFIGWSGTGLSGSNNMTVTIAKGSHDARSYTAHWQQNCDFTSKTFSYTGGTQPWTVPTGCGGTYKLEVYGAEGGNALTGSDRYTSTTGKGGYATGTVSLSAGTTLYVVVGGKGATANENNFSAGGYNGGGQGSWYNGGGGGATHIGKSNAVLKSTTSGNLYIVAGGGGGAGSSHISTNDNPGGHGGGTSGGNAVQSGSATYGYGGSQSAGGTSSWNFNGAYGQGGDVTDRWGGGGGGGGYYGGAGTGNVNGGVGGAGGSGYTGGVSGGSMSSGVQTGNGYAKITKQ